MAKLNKYWGFVAVGAVAAAAAGAVAALAFKKKPLEDFEDDFAHSRCPHLQQHIAR